MRPELKSFLASKVPSGWKRPEAPEASHNVSKLVPVLGNNATLSTGKYWQEHAMQGFFDKIEGELPGLMAAISAAKAVSPNPDLKIEVAALRCVSDRRKILEPAIVGFMGTCGAEVLKQFAGVDAFERQILALSEPEEKSGGLDLGTRKTLACGRGMLALERSGGSAQKVRESLLLALDLGDWDVVESLERNLPYIGFKDFEPATVRREWAVTEFPDLERVAKDRQSLAEFAYEVCGKLAGYARLAGYQALKHGLIGLESIPKGDFDRIEAMADFQPHPAFADCSKRIMGLLQKEQHAEKIVSFNK